MQWSRKLSKRTLWLILAVGLLVYALAALWAVPPALVRRRAERESIVKLAEASTKDQLNGAVGGLGVVLELPDRSWIAVRYRDSHSSATFFSSAVARTSDGRWLRSGVHHCGLFGAYAYERRMLADLAEEREPAAAEIRNSLLDTMAQGDRALLWQAEHASSLGEAIRALETLGLAPFTPRVMPARVSP